MVTADGELHAATAHPGGQGHRYPQLVVVHAVEAICGDDSHMKAADGCANRDTIARAFQAARLERPEG
jgi:hypothetical protein